MDLARIELRKIVLAEPPGNRHDDPRRVRLRDRGRPVFLGCSTGARLALPRDIDGARGLNVALRWYVVHAYSNFEHRVAESLKERIAPRRTRDAFRRDPRADRRSGRDARRPEAQERAQVLSRLRARADGDGRGDLAPGARCAEGAGLHRRHAGEAGGDHRQGSESDPAPRRRGRGQAAAEGAVRAGRGGARGRWAVQRLQRRGRERELREEPPAAWRCRFSDARRRWNWTSRRSRRRK